MAKNGERVWGKGAACGNDSCLQLCVFSVGGEVRRRVWAKKQCNAWRRDCGIGEERLTWKKVSHDRLLTLCALLTRLIGIVPAGCMKLERELM